MNRNLDGYYFRIKRDGKFSPVCFSDMTKEEKLKMLKGQSNEWLINLCIGLSETIKDIGDKLNLVIK